MGSNLGLTRLYGRAAPGQRVRDQVPGDRGGNVSTIGALGLEGIRTGLRVPGAVDGETRLFFVEELLGPTLKRGDIVVMDNNPIHKLDDIEDTIETVGAWVLFLPMYSPDLNPKNFESYHMATESVEKGQLPQHLLSLFLQDQELGDYLTQEPEEKEALRVSVRITVDFWHFLKNSSTVIKPSEHAGDYINGTIRSGLDFFHKIRDLENVLMNRKERMFEWSHYEGLETLKADFFNWFDILQQERISTQDRFYALFVLIRPVLIFWATTFTE